VKDTRAGCRGVVTTRTERWASVPLVSVSGPRRTLERSRPSPSRPTVVVIFFIPLTADLAPSPPNLGPVHAPASKLLTYGTVAASLLTHSLRAHHRVGLTHRGLFTRGEFASRWLSSQFTFTAPGEACVGIYLLYNLRHIERVRGTTRHVTHLLIASIVSLGLQTMLCNCDAPLARWLGLTGSAGSLLFIKNFQSVGFAPGPHSVIASLLIPGFTKLVPTTHTFTTGLGMRFGDKMFTYLAAAQLFASHGAASVIPACCGVVGSAVAEWIAGGPRGWTPPRWVCDVVEGTFGRVLRGGGGIAPRATVRRANARPGGGGGAARGDGRRAERFVEPTPAPPPPPGAVETLVSMGFDEHAARRALGMCGNDLEAATNILLAGGD